MFQIVSADPPWMQQPRNHQGTKFGRGAAGHYPLMSTDDICSIPVQDIIHDDAALFLWATCPKLADGLRVVEAWGFRYSTVAFCWVKTNKDGSLFFGPGFWTGSNVELCLLGVRGKASNIRVDPRGRPGIRQPIITPRMRHSQKPIEVAERIVELCGDRPRIELFCRDPLPGWHAVGNEINNLDVHEVITSIAENNINQNC